MLRPTFTGLAVALLLLANAALNAAPPSAPSMNVSVSGRAVTVTWNSVAGATGYALYYAPYPNVDYIGSGDMGTSTSFSVTVPPGAAYFVAVRARNRDGESPYSNIGTVIVPTGGTFVLNTGDYWEYESSSRTTSASGSGVTTTESSGTFRVTLGAPQNVGGRIAFPVIVTGEASSGKPVWKYLATDGPALLGTVDGAVYSTIFRGDTPAAAGMGFFSFFPPGRTAGATLVNVQGTHTTTAAWALSRSNSAGGCQFFREVGQTICDNNSSNFTETEYYKPGVGPVAYRFTSSLAAGGGFASVHNVLQTIELVKSSRVADDGVYFAGTPWHSLADLQSAPSIPRAAAYGRALLVFGSDSNSGGSTPQWVQSFTPGAGAWTPQVSSGATINALLGVSGGRLYAIGTLRRGGLNATATLSVLRFDAVTSTWESVAGTLPADVSTRTMVGAAAFANGELVTIQLLSISGSNSLLRAYVYNPTTGTWRRGADHAVGLNGPAVAAVGNDLYLIGGFRHEELSCGPSFCRVVTREGIAGDVRRYRAATNAWEDLPDQVNMPTPRQNAAAAVLGSKIYVIGGQDGTDQPREGRVVEIFDTATGAWSTGPLLPKRRRFPAAAVLDGTIYVIGGRESNAVGAETSTTFALSP